MSNSSYFDKVKQAPPLKKLDLSNSRPPFNLDVLFAELYEPIRDTVAYVLYNTPYLKDVDLYALTDDITQEMFIAMMGRTRGIIAFNPDLSPLPYYLSMLLGNEFRDAVLRNAFASHDVRSYRSDRENFVSIPIPTYIDTDMHWLVSDDDDDVVDSGLIVAFQEPDDYDDFGDTLVNKNDLVGFLFKEHEDLLLSHLTVEDHKVILQWKLIYGFSNEVLAVQLTDLKKESIPQTVTRIRKNSLAVLLDAGFITYETYLHLEGMFKRNEKVVL